MPEIGQTVFHYRIIKRLGGGMGEVCRAAITVMPEFFHRDPARMARASIEHADCSSYPKGDRQ
jgi:hypothetical protein